MNTMAQIALDWLPGNSGDIREESRTAVARQQG
jgi:hypothetical protein